MASVSGLVSAAHVSVSVSVLALEVPALSTGSPEPASVSRPASRLKLDGLSLGLGLGHPCLGLGLGLGGPGLDYNPDTGTTFLSCQYCEVRFLVYCIYCMALHAKLLFKYEHLGQFV